MERDEFWDILRENAKANHQERISKTPNRIEFASKLLADHNIRFELKNASTGHFHAWKKSNGQLYQFWAGTGKILGDKRRGIRAFIYLLCHE